jgi:hypothetical protein
MTDKLSENAWALLLEHAREDEGAGTDDVSANNP